MCSALNLEHRIGFDHSTCFARTSFKRFRLEVVREFWYFDKAMKLHSIILHSSSRFRHERWKRILCELFVSTGCGQSGYHCWTVTSSTLARPALCRLLLFKKDNSRGFFQEFETERLNCTRSSTQCTLALLFFCASDNSIHERVRNNALYTHYYIVHVVLQTPEN